MTPLPCLKVYQVHVSSPHYRIPPLQQPQNNQESFITKYYND